MIRFHEKLAVTGISLALACLVTAVFPNLQISADILYRQGDLPPIVGKVIREDSMEIVFREQFLSGASKERKFFKADILKLIKTIDNERLESLSPKNANAYFEYAEELAAYERDFVAKQLAMRLYLVAAFHSRGELQKSCFLGLLSFGLNLEEENRIRALAILKLDPKYQAQFSVAEERISDLNGLNDLLAAVKLLRQGETKQAGMILKQEEVRSAADEIGQIANWNDIYGYTLLPELKMEQLLVLVRLELHLIGDRAANKAALSGAGWESQAKRKMQTSQAWVRFENVTPFDPAESIYRNGKWQKPSR